LGELVESDVAPPDLWVLVLGIVTHALGMLFLKITVILDGLVYLLKHCPQVRCLKDEVIPIRKFLIGYLKDISMTLADVYEPLLGYVRIPIVSR
tara:strand:- start:685 stop:966 length:282 start_codon:yes stop_codon:yes gene_type:complete